MNVTSFLKLPLFTDFKLLAGKSGAENKITGVNILDNPKATDWLSPGELIVTSGYFFKESPQALKHFLESFKRLNIAAICIKPQIYLNPLPEELIDMCNSLAIPLIEIPYGVAFSKILNTVMNLLSNAANESAQMALDTNSKFLEYGLQGEGLDYLKQKLEGLLDNPLIITNSDWTLLSKSYSEEFQPYIKQKQQTLSFNTDCLSELPSQVEKVKHPLTIVFKHGKHGMLLPIYFNEKSYGYIIVLQQARALLQKDYIVLEQASITIAMQIVHQTEQTRISNKVLRDFYRKLLFEKKELGELRTYDIDFNYEIPYSVFIVTVDISEESNTDLLQRKYDEDHIMHNTLNAAKNYQHPLYRDIHLFKHGGYFIGLLGQANSSDNHETHQQRFFQDFHKYLQSSLTNSAVINIFVGSVQEIPFLNDSYKEAEQLVDYRLKNKSQLYFASHYYFETFLRRHINEKDARAFVEYYLSPLIEQDRKNGSDLIKTLDAYLQNHQNLALASRKLFIHRNTLLYRIEKIEGLLNKTISTEPVNMSLLMALKLSKEYPQV